MAGQCLENIGGCALLQCLTENSFVQAKDMPTLHNRLHYRVCDVSSIKGTSAAEESLTAKAHRLTLDIQSLLRGGIPS